jgi:hypothetical protein
MPSPSFPPPHGYSVQTDPAHPEYPGQHTEQGPSSPYQQTSSQQPGPRWAVSGNANPTARPRGLRRMPASANIRSAGTVSEIKGIPAYGNLPAVRAAGVGFTADNCECQILLENMYNNPSRQPVKLRSAKNSQGLCSGFYDYQSLSQWLLNGGKHPTTRDTIGKEDVKDWVVRIDN